MYNNKAILAPIAWKTQCSASQLQVLGKQHLTDRSKLSNVFYRDTFLNEFH